MIVEGTVLSAARLVRRGFSGIRSSYCEVRQILAGAIVLGPEFSVAGDITRTVAVDPTLQSVSVLGLIVLIRTFLSMMLHLEIEGRWPWQR